MPKIELVRGIESVEGWAEVARLLKQKMKKWGHQLKDWTVRVRAFSKEDEAKSGQGDEDAFSDLNREKKVLTVAFKPEPVRDPELEADMIMEIFWTWRIED